MGIMSDSRCSSRVLFVCTLLATVLQPQTAKGVGPLGLGERGGCVVTLVISWLFSSAVAAVCVFFHLVCCCAAKVCAGVGLFSGAGCFCSVLFSGKVLQSNNVSGDQGVHKGCHASTLMLMLGCMMVQSGLVSSGCCRLRGPHEGGPCCQLWGCDYDKRRCAVRRRQSALSACQFPGGARWRALGVLKHAEVLRVAALTSVCVCVCVV
jgi:hypothetical protein